MDLLCKENDIEHRLTQSHTPKTNGMVERANGIVKSNTILKEQYASNQDMEVALMQFLVFYMLSRRHGSLKIELGVPPLTKRLKNGTSSNRKSFHKIHCSLNKKS
mgnify:CR=1 FL=1